MRQESVTIQAPAKVNLSLQILGRRDDGYHVLATHMQKVSLYDTIELRSLARGIELRCPDSGVPEDRNNLVFRAAELFMHWAARNGMNDLGVAISLKKNIPVAAGLGGGSSDAAATLLGMNALFDAGCPVTELFSMGLQLGTDVPFFLERSSAAQATGIGEILQPLTPLRGYRILLVNPGFSVSTRWVYQTFALTEGGNAVKMQNSQEAVGDLDATGFPLLLFNDLERVTLVRYPEIDRLKTEVLAQGAKGGLMSGSGPTVFGIFQDLHKADAAVEFFRQKYRYTYLVDPL